MAKEKKNRGGAPLGNQNAVGNEGGRPPIFTNAKELQKKVDEYFEYVKGEFHWEDIGDNRIKQWDRDSEPITITGLSYFLGFESRSTFYEYQKKVEFSHILKRAALKVENNYECQLYNPKPTGAIFALKNMDWQDKQIFDHNLPQDSEILKSARERASNIADEE